MERIGFVGVGLMGEGMAHCALARGHPLTVLAHNKREAVERLLAKGANEARDPAALCEAADVIVLCVSNAEVVQDVAGALEPHLREGQLLIDTSTSQPAVTRAIADAFAAKRVAVTDAPVTGGPPQAAEGALATLLGAEADDLARASRIVEAWSKTVRHFGGVGTGHAAKLINNFVTQGTTALLAEAYTRARRAGLDWEALHAVQATGAANSGTFQKVVTPALEGDFEASRFSIANAHKDLRYYAEFTATMDGAQSPLAVAVRDAVAAFDTAGYGENHTTRMLEPAAADAVNPPPTPNGRDA